MPTIKPFKAILFDLEGTIIDTEPIWDECAIEFLKRHGRVYDRAATKHLLMGGSIADGAIIMRDQYKFKGDPETLAAERRDIFEQLLQREISFIPGFEAFYDQVKTRYKTAIATSMERRFIQDVDQRLHLSKLFENHLYSIEDIGFVPKPNPDIFLHAAGQIGADPTDCLVIEDAPHGVEAAHRAGMQCVAITITTTRERLAAANQIVDQYSGSPGPGRAPKTGFY
jgi:beta-phosphoglucomutase